MKVLAAQLANLVVSLATQPVRARREIFVREAIEVAQQLTTEHLNALSVQLYITSLKLGEPYFEPDWLIRALDTLLNHSTAVSQPTRWIINTWPPSEFATQIS